MMISRALLSRKGRSFLALDSAIVSKMSTAFADGNGFGRRGCYTTVLSPRPADISLRRLGKCCINNPCVNVAEGEKVYFVVNWGEWRGELT